MSNVPKPYFWSRIGSPWLRSGPNSARMNPSAPRNLLKNFPALRESFLPLRKALFAVPPPM